MTSKLTNAQIALLRALASQRNAAQEYPGAYTPELWLGSRGCHASTGRALVTRGLVDAGVRCDFDTITINAAGEAALAAGLSL